MKTKHIHQNLEFQYTSSIFRKNTINSSPIYSQYNSSIISLSCGQSDSFIGMQQIPTELENVHILCNNLDALEENPVDLRNGEIKIIEIFTIFCIKVIMDLILTKKIL